MTLESMADSRLWLVASSTMLHFLWTGAIVAFVAAVVRRTLSGPDGSFRVGGLAGARYRILRLDTRNTVAIDVKAGEHARIDLP